MSDVMARLSAIACAVLLLIAVGVLYVTSQPDLAGRTEVKAEFQDVYPLLTGMDVREWGAPAGTVAGIDLTDHGTVVVTMALNAGTTPPTANATASIREQDITGDSYVDLSPGTASKPLADAVIPTSRTLRAPRFDDLLNTFSKPVQQSLQILLDQLGMAVQGRGEDLNRAELRLRPALAAADSAAREVASQNSTLRSLIGDTEHVTGQLASGSDDLGRLVDSLARVTQTTAAHSSSLDQALALAPRTAARARVTLARLRGLAVAGLPLARTLGGAAPELAKTARLLGPFVGDASSVLGDVAPTLALTRKLFVASEPTLKAGPHRVFTAPFDIAAGTGKLLTSLVGQRDIVRSLFGADGYGRGHASHNDVGLAATAVERGDQQGYPANYDPQRFFLRASTVLSCESFGVPIAPGCLSSLMAKSASQPDAAGTDSSGGGSGDASGSHRDQPTPPSAGTPAAPNPVGHVGDTVGRILHQVPRHIHLPKPPLGGGDGPIPKPGSRALHDLLDFVLGP